MQRDSITLVQISYAQVVKSLLENKGRQPAKEEYFSNASVRYYTQCRERALSVVPKSDVEEVVREELTMSNLMFKSIHAKTLQQKAAAYNEILSHNTESQYAFRETSLIYKSATNASHRFFRKRPYLKEHALKNFSDSEVEAARSLISL